MYTESKIFQLNATDGHPIGACLFSGETKGKHLIIICSAAGVLQSYYTRFAQFACARYDFDVVTFDYRDMGESIQKPVMTSPSCMSDWGRYDLDGVISWASDKYDKVFLLGHSIAGQIFPLARNRSRIAAAYFVASQDPYLSYWSGWHKFKVFLFWYFLLPMTVGFYGFMPGWVLGGYTSLAKGVAKEWKKWGTNKNGISISDPKAPQKYDAIRVPVHFVGFADDKVLAPGDAVQALMRKYGNAKTSYQYIKPEDMGLKTIGHFGFFRSKHQEKLWSMPVFYFSQFVNKF